MVPWEMPFHYRASLKIELAELRSTEIAVSQVHGEATPAPGMAFTP